MGDWALRDIGRAVTKVWLGTMNYSDMENKFNYQEFGVSGMESPQGSDQLKMYPAEKWSSHFGTFSDAWESVQQLNAYKLKLISDADAPKQTLIFGYLSPESTIPDLIAADESYYPLDSEYVVPEVSGGETVSVPSSESDLVEQSFLPPIQPGPDNVSPVQAAASLLREVPFIPSSVDHLAYDAQQYKDLIGDIGVKIHNIWNIAPSMQGGNIRYLKNSGPIWQSSGWAGATAEQAGEPGALRVKVNANKSSLLLYRIAPMNCDIGYDSNYPWVFPYADTNPTSPTSTYGAIKHGAMFDLNNESGYFGNEYRAEGGKTTCPNVGFVMNFEVSAEGPRGTFATSGGGTTPIISVGWGWGKGKPPTGIEFAQSPYADSSDFATSFYVTFAHDKIPILNYHDGTRVVNIQLEDNPIDFTKTTNLSLVVEYLSTSILVRTHHGSKLISGQSGANTSGLKGVWTENPNISVFVAGCTAIFDFSPAFYNPWDPAADISLGADPNNIEMTSLDNNYHSQSNLSFNPSIPETGFAKLIAASCFNTYAEPSSAKAVLDNLADTVWEAFRDQTYTPMDMRLASNPFGDSKFKPEAGWPQCILDSRNISEELGGNPVFLPIAKIYNFGSGVLAGATNAYLPTTSNQDPISTLSLIWQVRTTYTTPLIFGFKTKDEPQITWPNSPWKDISEYVSKWDVNWAAEQDYKVLRAKGSVTLLNPPGYIIDIVSKNRMHIQISDCGYPKYSQAVDENIKPYLYRQDNIFTGLTVGSNLSFGPGGDVYFTIECVDPLKLLEDYNFETNLRFDGVSFFMAFSMMMQASDYGSMFVVDDFINNETTIGGWKQTWRGGPTIHQHYPAITWDRMSTGLYYYSSMFFGFQPMSGRSYEVQPGSPLFASLMDVIKNMHNPASLPLFYFRPSDGKFVFQVRDGRDNAESRTHRPNLKSEISKEIDLKTYLPLLCLGNSEAYKMVSDTSNLTSHFTVTGSDRADGSVIKATAINPKWHSMDKYNLNEINDYATNASGQFIGVTEHNAPISSIFGHLGYKRRTFQGIGNFVTDIYGAFSYAVSRIWWLMRPVITINDLTVYGIIDYLDDGLLTIDLSGLPYKKALLQNSNISYDANEGTIVSKFSVFLFPPWTM